MVEGDEGGAGGEVEAVDAVAVEAEEALPSFMAHHLFPSTRSRMTLTEALTLTCIIMASANRYLPGHPRIHTHTHTYIHKQHTNIFHLAVAVQ